MAVNENSTGLFFHRGHDSWLLGYEAYDDDNPIIDCFDLSDEDNINPGRLHSLGQWLNGRQAASFGSSCGLVSLQAYNDDSIFVYNPTLNQCRRISAAPHPFKKSVIFLRGFGFVSSIDDFKIVLGFKDKSADESDPVMYVFSLRRNNWTMIQGDHHLRILSTCKFVRNGILVNENLHWWIKPVHCNDNDGRIFAFDLLHEVFEEIPITEVLVPRVRTFELSMNTEIAAIEGCLCLFICQHNNIELWMLHQYGDIETWAPQYDLNNMPGHQYHFSEFFGFTRTGKILILGWDVFYACHVFLVDPSQENPTLTSIGHLGPSNAGFPYNVESGVVYYARSLIAPLGFGKPVQERGWKYYVRAIIIFVAAMVLLRMMFLFV